ncbi:hypothetical protein FQZ97_1025440 [compost metagenome]
MIHGIAQQVGEYRTQLVENALVDLQVAAANLQVDALAGLAGEVLDHRRQSLHQAAAG